MRGGQANEKAHSFSCMELHRCTTREYIFKLTPKDAIWCHKSDQRVITDGGEQDVIRRSGQEDGDLRTGVKEARDEKKKIDACQGKTWTSLGCDMRKGFLGGGLSKGREAGVGVEFIGSWLCFEHRACG